MTNFTKEQIKSGLKALRAYDTAVETADESKEKKFDAKIAAYTEIGVTTREEASEYIAAIVEAGYAFTNKQIKSHEIVYLATAQHYGTARQKLKEAEVKPQQMQNKTLEVLRAVLGSNTRPAMSMEDAVTKATTAKPVNNKAKCAQALKTLGEHGVPKSVCQEIAELLKPYLPAPKPKKVASNATAAPEAAPSAAELDAEMKALIADQVSQAVAVAFKRRRK